MRRRITLYIADQQVDLDDQSLILFNYTQEDLSNPTIVKNSYSQQITLKGTPGNNRIFGGSYRTDRQIADTGGDAGVDYNASRRTPFLIQDEMGEILESGYAKLDSVSRQGEDIQYKVSLYGGLGSFLYALSYDDQGRKRTLADLDYLGSADPASELDFVITRESVQEAWNRLRSDPSVVSSQWDVINFAPAWNGIPEGNFAADKALAIPSEVGLLGSRTSDGVQYDTRAGYALVNMAEAQDEWSVKDLRSYLQRPVFSIKAFWEAVCDPGNNGGYDVDASAIQDLYDSLWMTLPMITSLGSVQGTGSLTLDLQSSPSASNEVGRFVVQGSVPAGTIIDSNLNCRIRFNVPGASQETLQDRASYTYGRNTAGKFSAIFIQAVAFGSDNSVVGGSRIYAIGARGRGQEAAMASQCGYIPLWSESYEGITLSAINRVSPGVYEIPRDFSFSIEAQDVSYYKILVSVYPGTSQQVSGGGASSYTQSFSGDGSISIPILYADYNTGYTPSSSFIVQGTASNTITYSSSESLRSGAAITKAMLLATSNTPADYLLSFCKVFGLYLVYENATRSISVLRRGDLYQDEVIDLSRRVDLSNGMTIRPYAFTSKWYEMLLPAVGGAYNDDYTQVEGLDYGIQRINTGYDFDSSSVNLMDSVVFRNACTILGRSRYLNIIHKIAGQNRIFQPSPYIDKGNTYTLWSATGETLETDISCPPSNAQISYYNADPNLKGYDIQGAAKMEFRSADNKPVEGSDVLVHLTGWKRYDLFNLTDDLPAMDTICDGQPCWILHPGQTGSDALEIPIFGRYIIAQDRIGQSLDFGVPRQIGIPGVTYDPDSTIYARGWRSYLGDRYDHNTKVMTCQVNWAGIQVNQALLRKFYWYGGSLWALNRITNYSLTTYDPVECEFVQVQDRANYLTGQNY